MSILAILFSFRGRMARSDYWRVAFPIHFISIVMFYYLMYRTVLLYPDTLPTQTFILIALFANLALNWSLFAAMVKRMHDCNKSAWLFLLFAIPIIGGFVYLWLMFVVWFIKGTQGQNRFGPDPLKKIRRSKRTTQKNKPKLT